MSDKEPIVHPEEWGNAAREGRPVLVSRLFRYDHLIHKIPLGSLVKVDLEIHSGGRDGSEVQLSGTCTLYVVGHMRDCDGTPLYMLSDIPVVPPKQTFSPDWMKYKALSHVYEHGYSEESLTPTGKFTKLKNTLWEFLSP